MSGGGSKVLWPVFAYFYKYMPPRPLDKIEADLKKIEKEIADMLAEVTQ